MNNNAKEIALKLVHMLFQCGLIQAEVYTQVLSRYS